MHTGMKFYNVNLADLRDMVHHYDMQSMYRAVHALNGSSFEHIGLLGEIQVGGRVSEYVDLEHVSHTINDLNIVDDMIIGHVTILDTPAGRIVRNSLVNGGKLICGFSMASIVELDSDGDCVVDRIVAFHLAPEKSPITRVVDWAGVQPLREVNRNRGTIPVKEGCSDFGSCVGSDNSHLLTLDIFYEGITEPDRNVVEDKRVIPCEVIETRTVESTYTCSAPTETGGSSDTGYSD